MTRDEMASAAHHEAGHVVLGLSQGRTPSYVEITYNTARSRWEGTTEFPELSGPSVDEKIVMQIGTCVAGCFAQVKHAVRMIDSTEPIPWQDLFEWMVYRSDTPLELTLSGGTSVTVPPWWFEGQDKQTLDYIADLIATHLGPSRVSELLHRAIPKTAATLDDDVWWKRLEAIAILIVRSVEGDTGRLYGADIPT